MISTIVNYGNMPMDIYFPTFNKDWSTRIFKSGRFDILNVGHIASIEYCVKHSFVNTKHIDILLHDAKNTVIPCDQRRQILMALKYVNNVFVYKQDTEEDLLKELLQDPKCYSILYHSDELKNLDQYKLPGYGIVNEIMFVPYKLVEGALCSSDIKRLIRNE